MNPVYFFTTIITVCLLIDVYLFSMVRLFLKKISKKNKNTITIIYWTINLLLLISLLIFFYLDTPHQKGLRTFFFTLFFIILIGKIFVVLFLLLDDIRRGITFLLNLLPRKPQPKYSQSRAEFMSKVGIVAGTIPVVTLSFGIFSSAHDYRVRKKTIYFDNLPKAFDGIRIGQISDIHTGSFFNKTAVVGGVDMLNFEKPDIVFFTGDLVNNKSEEAKDYLDVFNKIVAPMGIYSIMGNHDYGDYERWSSKETKQKDIRNLHEMHKYMGYRLLLNENEVIKINGEEIAILGCENWGKGRFSKYGNMEKTVAGVEEYPFKILLSHDPSHWDAQIRPDYPDIDLMLSGHTHGFQFGIEIGSFKWSPSQYLYKQWAGLYQENNQYLYVNRGYGYIGYPGRVGILPEITILELKRSI